MPGFHLISREDKFYTHFITMSGELMKAARLLEEMLGSDPPEWDKAEEVAEIEHTCDFITHKVCQQLRRTYAIPIDREDIHAIVSSLDDVMDSIEATASYVRLYHIEKVRPAARELAHIVTVSAAELHLALDSLHSRKGVIEHVVEVNRLETEADRAHHLAIKELFEDEKDPIALLKWKEILDYLEDTTDRCEDVADILGGIVLKHGNAR